MTNQPISEDVEAARRRLSANERERESARQPQPDMGAREAGNDVRPDSSESLTNTVSSFASAVADRARELPGAETARAAAQDAADRIAVGADYLRSADSAQLGRDLIRLVKDHPVPSLVAAAVVGFMFGRSVSRES